MCSAHTHLSLKFICCWLNHTQKGLLCWMGIQSCPSHVSFMYVKGPPHQKEPRRRQQEWQRHGFLGRSRHVKMKVPGCVPAVPFSWPLLAWPGRGYPVVGCAFFVVSIWRFFFTKCSLSINPQISCPCMVSWNHTVSDKLWHDSWPFSPFWVFRAAQWLTADF